MALYRVNSGLQSSNIPSNYLLDCVSVGPLHRDKTADQIWIRFGMVGRMGPGMRQAVGIGDRSTGGSNPGSNCGAPHCNQWAVCGVEAPSQITLGFLVAT